MWDDEIRGMASAHAIVASSIFMATVMPAVFVENFSVYGTHMVWLHCVAGSVAVVNIAVFWLLGISPPTKKNTLSYKIEMGKMFSQQIVQILSVLFTVIHASHCRSALETFSLAVLLSTLTTLRCLCILGPNVQAWIRVFSRDGAMSVWDTSLQITTGCSVIGAWLGALPIPLDWDRPWQIWPISCTLGATTGFLTGLLAAPVWIHWHRKQLTYKLK
uniref:Phosphatidylinositol-glycan biosynthesis class F protein-like n=1 Tax=Sinocyclocheilus anshuiensis TaxID=1608454 RepID=A0A671SJP3_9TELE